MEMTKFCFLTLTFCLSGCTSMFKVMTDDPVRSTNIVRENGNDRVGAMATISLDATRRNVLVSLTDKRFGQFCAEPPPDTASAIESLLDASIKANAESGEKKAGAESSLKDQYKSNVVVIAKRSDVVEVYRTGTYAICQFYLNGAMDEPGVTASFLNLTNKVLERIPLVHAEIPVASVALDENSKTLSPKEHDGEKPAPTTSNPKGKISPMIEKSK